tara:strand:- start:1162 stop:1353 length:192 start_codon:yes stop_codon:yes gene_type:complete
MRIQDKIRLIVLGKKKYRKLKNKENVLIDVNEKKQIEKLNKIVGFWDNFNIDLYSKRKDAKNR